MFESICARSQQPSILCNTSRQLRNTQQSSAPGGTETWGVQERAREEGTWGGHSGKARKPTRSSLPLQAATQSTGAVTCQVTGKKRDNNNNYISSRPKRTKWSMSNYLIWFYISDADAWFGRDIPFTHRVFKAYEEKNPTRRPTSITLNLQPGHIWVRRAHITKKRN